MATHTLLVADDSQTVQRIIEMACAGEDVDVVAVGDGDLAIARITDQPPDIVLADIGMPRRSGYDVAAFVKGRSDLAHIPVILLAGMFQAADEARAKAVGCAEILVKPLKPQHVMGRVRHWIDAAAAVERTAGPVTASADEAVTPEQSAEDYFSRLDAAFKSLGPLGARIGGAGAEAGGSAASGNTEPVPTLQELLDRLPEATRTLLTPALSAADTGGAAADDRPVLDAIAARVVDQISRRDDVLDAIARRVVQMQHQDDRR